MVKSLIYAFLKDDLFEKARVGGGAEGGERGRSRLPAEQGAQCIVGLLPHWSDSLKTGRYCIILVLNISFSVSDYTGIARASEFSWYGGVEHVSLKKLQFLWPLHNCPTIRPLSLTLGSLARSLVTSFTMLHCHCCFQPFQAGRKKGTWSEGKR